MEGPFAWMREHGNVVREASVWEHDTLEFMASKNMVKGGEALMHHRRFRAWIEGKSFDGFTRYAR